MAATGALNETRPAAATTNDHVKGAGPGLFHNREKVGLGAHPRFNSAARLGLGFAQILTLLGFIITLSGLSALQRQANTLQLDEATAAVYTDVFQSAGQVPYPGAYHDQFGLQWWLLWFELAIFILILVLLAVPRHLLRFKPALLVFLGYFFTLVTLQVQSLLFFKRNPAANLVYGKKRIKATLAGALIVVISNGLSIIFLGLLREDYADAGFIGNEEHKRVAQDPVYANNAAV